MSKGLQSSVTSVRRAARSPARVGWSSASSVASSRADQGVGAASTRGSRASVPTITSMRTRDGPACPSGWSPATSASTATSALAMVPSIRRIQRGTWRSTTSWRSSMVARRSILPTPACCAARGTRPTERASW